MSLPAHHLELLSPAKTVEIGREAILHGADAVYIGGPSFGARHNACNEVSEIAELVKFAHRYHARIFTTLNTILHDAELEAAQKLVWQLYDAGVDALIIQDMGLLELDLPPIQLHASTQCDIRTPEKAKFLSDAGFSQVVLARELTVPQIKKVAEAVGTDATIEYFIHGALCVAFSGQCFISHADTGRSANRGDCSQACRLPYTLTDKDGGVVAFEKHLLSMKDNNQTANMEALIDAGVRSFKIEGRYKDVSYVKNITAHYRLLLDEILESRPELARASSGSSEIYFDPNPEKTFNRGSTDYFATGRKIDIGAFDSPKFVGVPVGHVTRVGQDWLELETAESLANGDGLNFMKKREVIGVPANTVQHMGQGEDGEIWRVWPNEPQALQGLKVGTTINRNRDHAWELALLKKSAERRIGVWLSLADSAEGLILTVTDEDGVSVTALANLQLEPARDAAKAEAGLRDSLAKLGNTMFFAHDVTLNLQQPWFVPASSINALRRDAIEQLEAARLKAWPRQPRKAPVEPPVEYPEKSLSYLANVYNQAAWQFYRKHGVEVIDAAYEAHQEEGEVSLMITKHCLRFSYNLCPKQAKGVKGVMGQVRAEPMTLKTGNETYTLKFECRPCEMHVMGKMKKHILASPPPSEIPATAPITFFKQRPQ
ncbi:U32 family peptidase [Crenobacter sp. SG2305]|uniref:peptidase U32 family protein n=1 Tax=Crenobacter oryzisoli TaxID=3056844 RepID=UPI0025AAAC12|nr:U32 family peptidase [Crenobacter sp. SG2305]MDN0083678.1 U32 family peptidase [Crenobacter sp. SG2305]